MTDNVIPMPLKQTWWPKDKDVPAGWRVKVYGTKDHNIIEKVPEKTNGG